MDNGLEAGGRMMIRSWGWFRSTNNIGLGISCSENVELVTFSYRFSLSSKAFRLISSLTACGTTAHKLGQYFSPIFSNTPTWHSRITGCKDSKNSSGFIRSTISSIVIRLPREREIVDRIIVDRITLSRIDLHQIGNMEIIFVELCRTE